MTLAVFSLMGAWNSFLWPFIMDSTYEMQPLTVALRSFQTEYGTEWGLMMVGSLIAMLPMLINFLAAQRNLSEASRPRGFGGR